MKHNRKEAAFFLQTMYIALIFLTLGIVFLLIKIYSFFPEPSKPALDLILDQYLSGINPQPTEKFVFLSSVFFIPLIAFFSICSLSLKLTTDNILKIKSPLLQNVLLPIIIVAIVFIPFIGSDLLFKILANTKILYSLPNYSFIIFFTITCLMFFVLVKPFSFFEKYLNSKKLKVIIWFFLIINILLQIFSWRLLGINSVTRDTQWSVHADTIYYTISQVVAGKTILVDLPSQYGLYPEFLAPFLKIIGLSVLKVSVIFAVLQLLTLSALFYVLSKLIKNNLLFLVSGFTLTLMTYGNYSFFWAHLEPYYQYWPIRFIWPSFSVLAFYLFSLNKKYLNVILFSILSAIGILWNLDTGIFIGITFGAYLILKLIISNFQKDYSNKNNFDVWNSKNYLVATLLHILTHLVVFILFYGYLFLKSSQPPEIIKFIEYQNFFYGLGFLKLPLPTSELNPWMSLLAVYLLGIVYSFYSWLRNPGDKKVDSLFYLSILGTGLFFYYQGRSIELIFIIVTWPGIMIAAILIDKSIRAVRLNIISKLNILPPAIIITIFIACFNSQILQNKFLIKMLSFRINKLNIAQDPYVSNEINFIKSFAVEKKECLILSLRQGIYYTEANLASPIKGPGYIETFFKADQKKLEDQVLSGTIPCIFFGVGNDSALELDIDKNKILKKYKLISTNSINSMLYFEPLGKSENTN